MAALTWDAVRAWALSPDTSRAQAGAAAPMTHTVKVPLPDRMTQSDERASALAALTFAVLSKCEGAEAVVAYGVSGDALFPLLNPFAADRAATVSGAASSVRSAAAPAGCPAKTAADVKRASKGTPSIDSAIIGGVAIVTKALFDAIGDAASVKCFDVAFVLDADNSAVSLCFNQSLYDSQVMRDRVELLVDIAEAFASKGATATLRDLPSTTQSMRDRVLRDWQIERIPVKMYDRTMHSLIEEGCSKCGDPETALCIVDAATGEKATWAATMRRARNIARYLWERLPDVAWGSDTALIGIHLPRGVEWQQIMVGVFFAGAGYVPLDTTFPPDRLSFSLQDCESVAMFTRPETIDTVEFPTGTTIAVDDAFWAAVDAFSDDAAFTCPATPSTPGYVLYTSGSTGKPKGVLVEQVSVVHSALCFRILMEDRPVVAAQTCTMSFDLSVAQTFQAYCTGGAVVVVQTQDMSDPDLFTRILSDNGVTLLGITPSLLATLDAHRMTQSLRWGFVCGEACPPEVAARFAGGPGRPWTLMNLYGPTETTCGCTGSTLRGEGPITIGRVLPGYFACIVNTDMELLPPGVPGELVVAGPGVTRGYVKRPDMTAAKFGACPYLSVPKREWAPYDEETASDPRYQRLYHTGDLCRYTPDGNIEFLGRIDLQVKLRGFRIEIEEIENVLLTHSSGIKNAAVAKRSQHGVEFLCGYFQMQDPAAETPSDASLAQHLAKSVPPYMVPARFMRVEGFAYTPAGKLDRKALPEPPAVAAAVEDSSSRRKVRPPRTRTEHEVIDVWGSLFPTFGAISIDDHFFDDLNGTSILAGRALTGLRRKGYQVALRNLYEHPTVAALAAHFDEANKNGVEPPQPGLPLAFQRPSTLRRTLIGIWQLVFGVFAVANIWLVLVPIQFFVEALGLDLHERTLGLPLVVGGMLAAGIAILQLIFLLIVLPLLKWIIIQRRQPGQYWLYSWYAVRWWTVRALYDAFPTGLYSHMNVVTWIYRICGADVGAGSLLPANITESDLLTIGDDVYIAPTAVLITSQVIDQQLVLKRIRIGNGVSIDACACVEGGAVVPDRCVVRPMAVVRETDALRESCDWAAPGKDAGDAPALPQPSTKEMSGGTSLLQGTRPARPSTAARFFIGVAQVLALIVAYTVTLWMHFTFVYAMVLDGKETFGSRWFEGYITLLMALLGVFMSGIFFAILSLLCLRLTLPGLKGFHEGTYSVTSLDFQRWFMFQKIQFLASFIYPVLGTSFAIPWLRAAGVTVGVRSTVGMIAGFTPGLTAVGDDTFVADFSVLNPPFVYGGYITFKPVRIGDGTMIGNNSVVACRNVGDGVMIAASTLVLEDVPDNKLVLGAPPLITTRSTQGFTPAGLRRKLQGLHNLVDVLLGQFLTLIAISFAIGLSTPVDHQSKTGGVGYIFLALFVFVVALEVIKWVLLLFFKWAISGRIVATKVPIDSSLCWRYQSQFALVLAIIPMGIMYVLRGSVIFPWVLRLLGMRVGSNSFVDTVQIPECDLASVGDDCSINALVTLGTHTAEDGVMKYAPVTVGDRVTLMVGAVIAPTARIGTGCSVAAMASVSKGERLAERTHWAGMSVQRVAAPAIMRVSDGGEGAHKVEMTEFH